MMDPMPPVNERRPYDEEAFGDDYLESDNDWIENNMDAVIWFLENADAIRRLVAA